MSILRKPRAWFGDDFWCRFLEFLKPYACRCGTSPASDWMTLADLPHSAREVTALMLIHDPIMKQSPQFDDQFREQFRALLAWRRDVRHFRSDPLPEELLDELLKLAGLAPSVGLSEPWRFIRVDGPDARERIRVEFERANAEALSGYDGDQAALYARLKLAGLREAPVHLAVFADHATTKGSGLGRHTMPETLDYSVVGAIITLWLAARAYGIGLGWVSILNPDEVCRIVDAPQEWRLIAYLCLGYADQEAIIPELEREGWERRSC